MCKLSVQPGKSRALQTCPKEEQKTWKMLFESQKPLSELLLSELRLFTNTSTCPFFLCENYTV